MEVGPPEPAHDRWRAAFGPGVTLKAMNASDLVSSVYTGKLVDGGPAWTGDGR